jgi:hypothetical protein
MPAKKTPQKQSKSDFIRQHTSLSTADVIAKAKGAGLKVSSSLVYMVRGRGGAKKGAAKKGPPTPKTVISRSAVTVSKADFVRARSHLSPKEVVEDAKGAGIKFDVTYVYNVRGADKAAAKKKRASRKTSTLAVTNGIGPSITATATSAEDLLRAAAAEVGLGRAIELLQGERARVSAILRG